MATLNTGSKPSSSETQQPIATYAVKGIGTETPGRQTTSFPETYTHH